MNGHWNGNAAITVYEGLTTSIAEGDYVATSTEDVGCIWSVTLTSQ
jgi:hypothetical protein